MRLNCDQLLFRFASNTFKVKFFNDIGAKLMDFPCTGVTHYLFCQFARSPNYVNLSTRKLSSDIFLSFLETFCKIRVEFLKLGSVQLKEFDDTATFNLIIQHYSDSELNLDKNTYENEFLNFVNTSESHILTSLGFKEGRFLQIEPFSEIVKIFLSSETNHTRVLTLIKNQNMNSLDLFELFRKKFFIYIDQFDELEIHQKLAHHNEIHVRLVEAEKQRDSLLNMVQSALELSATFESQNEKLTEEFTAAKTEIIKLMKKDEKLEKEYDKMLIRIRKLEASRNSLWNIVDYFKSSSENSQLELSNMEEELNASRMEVAQLKLENERHMREHGEALRQLDAADSRNLRITRELNSTYNDRDRADMAEMNEFVYRLRMVAEGRPVPTDSVANFENSLDDEDERMKCEE